MENMNARKYDVALDISIRNVHELGLERAVIRQAGEDVTDKLRRACLTANAVGISDRQVARAAGVSMSTLRIWLGKRNDTKHG